MYLQGLWEWALEGKCGVCDIVVTNAGKNINLPSKKAVEKIWWFGYNKEKVSKQERRKHYAGNDKNAARSVY